MGLFELFHKKEIEAKKWELRFAVQDLSESFYGKPYDLPMSYCMEYVNKKTHYTLRSQTVGLKDNFMMDVDTVYDIAKKNLFVRFDVYGLNQQKMDAVLPMIREKYKYFSYTSLSSFKIYAPTKKITYDGQIKDVMQEIAKIWKDGGLRNLIAMLMKAENDSKK